MLNKKAIFIQDFTFEEVLPHIAKHKHVFDTTEKGQFIVYLGKATQRLFASAQTCVECGKVGTHFRLYHDPTQRIPKFINSMCLFTDDGILMTADHIIPRSAGGITHAVNLQVMCQKCNQKKAANMPPEEIVAPIREQMAEIMKEWEEKYPEGSNLPNEAKKKLLELKNDIN